MIKLLDYVTNFNKPYIFEEDIYYLEIVGFIINYLSNKLSFNKKHLKYEIIEFIIEEVTNTINGTLYERLFNSIIEKRKLQTFFTKLTLDINLNTVNNIELKYIHKNNYNKNTDKLEELLLELKLPKKSKYNFYSNQIKKKLLYEIIYAYEDYIKQCGILTNILYKIKKLYYKFIKEKDITCRLYKPNLKY